MYRYQQQRPGNILCPFHFTLIEENFNPGKVEVPRPEGESGHCSGVGERQQRLESRAVAVTEMTTDDESIQFSGRFLNNIGYGTCAQYSNNSK